MERKTFVFYADWYEALEDFENDFRQRIIEAIVQFALYDKIPTEQDILRSPFAIIRKQIERDNEKYQAKCLKNRENVKKRYQSSTNDNDKKPKDTNDNEDLPNSTNVYERIQSYTTEGNCKQLNTNEGNCSNSYYNNDNDNDNDNDIVSEHKCSSTIFSEPNGSVSTHVDARNKNEIDFNEIAREFNLAVMGKSIPQIEKMTDKRKSAVRARIKEYGRDAVSTAIRNASESYFLNGDNNRGWKADFDWIFSPNNFPKVIEGNYNNAKPQYNTNTAASGHACEAAEQRNDEFMQHILNKLNNAPRANSQPLW